MAHPEYLNEEYAFINLVDNTIDSYAQTVSIEPHQWLRSSRERIVCQQINLGQNSNSLFFIKSFELFFYAWLQLHDVFHLN